LPIPGRGVGPFCAPITNKEELLIDPDVERDRERYEDDRRLSGLFGEGDEDNPGADLADSDSTGGQ